jgi:transposase
MSHPRLVLAGADRAALEAMVRRGDPAYLREKAAALLRIADGMTPTAVARMGVLRPRNRKTVSRWLVRYQDEGIAGLTIRPGRGRKPAFSPSGRQ